MAEEIVFGYWGIRGLGQVPRLVLAYSGLNWKDVKYTERDQWFAKDRTGLGLQFPNLPYLIDGDFKLSES
jgi:glutathione S-transferase